MFLRIACLSRDVRRVGDSAVGTPLLFLRISRSSQYVRGVGYSAVGTIISGIDDALPIFDGMWDQKSIFKNPEE